MIPHFAVRDDRPNAAARIFHEDPGFPASIRKRMRIEEIFACAKTIAGLRAKGSLEEALDALGRGFNVPLEPSGERRVEEVPGLGLGEDLEVRVDAGLDRPCAQELGAEGVDGPDVGQLELIAAMTMPAPGERPKVHEVVERTRELSAG